MNDDDRLKEAYDSCKPVTAYREDGRLLVKEWPGYAAFDVWALEHSRPDILQLDGLITMTMTDGTYANGGKASYRILGVRNGVLICQREVQP